MKHSYADACVGVRELELYAPGIIQPADKSQPFASFTKTPLDWRKLSHCVHGDSICLPPVRPQMSPITLFRRQLVPNVSHSYSTPWNSFQAFTEQAGWCKFTVDIKQYLQRLQTTSLLVRHSSPPNHGITLPWLEGRGSTDPNRILQLRQRPCCQNVSQSRENLANNPNFRAKVEVKQTPASS